MPPPAFDAPSAPISIAFDEHISTVNVLNLFARQQVAVPPALSQLAKALDFHYFELKGLVKPLHGSKGVSAFRIDTQLQPSGSGQAQADDIGPQTSWVPASGSATLSLKLDFDSLGQVLRLVGLPASPPISGELALSYAWNPKVSVVISGTAGAELFWQLGAARGQYVDGGHSLVGVIRRRRDVKQIWLRIRPGLPDRAGGTWAEYSMRWRRQKAVLAGGNDIPIDFEESPVPI
ncbi:MAG: hypothetical protein ACHQ2Y_09310 [Candidatus Lutacidiplasmatales archaeon]